MFCLVYHIKVSRSSHNAFSSVSYFCVCLNMDPGQIDIFKSMLFNFQYDSWIKALFSEYKNYAVNFGKTTITTTNNSLFHIHFKRDYYNFSKRIQFLNRFNESPLKLRKTQLVLILIDVISQLVAGINSAQPYSWMVVTMVTRVGIHSRIDLVAPIASTGKTGSGPFTLLIHELSLL